MTRAGGCSGGFAGWPGQVAVVGGLLGDQGRWL